MALFFNLQNLEAMSKGETKQLIYLLKLFHNKKLIPKSKLYTFNLAALRGKSFLLNPEALFNDKTVDPSYVAQYIRLAGRRSYTLYKFYNAKYLDTSFYPELNIDNISHNPLLKIANKQIHFKYEEN